jgi:hypothetical protein
VRDCKQDWQLEVPRAQSVRQRRLPGEKNERRRKRSRRREEEDKWKEVRDERMERGYKVKQGRGKGRKWEERNRGVEEKRM